MRGILKFNHDVWALSVGALWGLKGIILGKCKKVALILRIIGRQKQQFTYMAKHDERTVCKARRVQPRSKDGRVEDSAATHNQIVDIRAWNLDGSW